MTNGLPIESALSTDRLMLELVKVEDYDFILSLVNSKEWIENIGDRQVRSKEDAISYILKILTTENFFYWVVRTKEDNTPIGIISFLKRSYLEHFDIGFAFLPDFMGKGYAYEGAKAVLDRVTKRPEFNTVLALTKGSNKKSIHLLDKLGFSFQNTTAMENEKLDIFVKGNPSTQD
jgi:ribosomal-protein-alanine N-acetyltransferase